jgi:hypothetical protein
MNENSPLKSIDKTWHRSICQWLQWPLSSLQAQCQLLKWMLPLEGAGPEGSGNRKARGICRPPRTQAEADSSSKSHSHCSWSVATILGAAEGPQPSLHSASSHEYLRSLLLLTAPRVQLRKTQVHLPNSGYTPDCSGLFFLPFLNLIWACSLKGEVLCSDWLGPIARSQETAYYHQWRCPACFWPSLLIQTARLPSRDV